MRTCPDLGKFDDRFASPPKRQKGTKAGQPAGNAGPASPNSNTQDNWDLRANSALTTQFSKAVLNRCEGLGKENAAARDSLLELQTSIKAELARSSQAAAAVGRG